MYNYNLLAILIFIYFFVRFLLVASKKIALLEWTAVHFAFFYLLSPAVSYLLNTETIYQMKVPPERYFPIAIGGFFCYYLGLNFFNNKGYLILNSKTNSDVNSKEVGLVSKKLFQRLLVIGLVCMLIIQYVPANLRFFIYLVGSLRYVGAMSLYVFERNNKYLLLGGLFDLYLSLNTGMFHDLIIYMIFCMLLIFFVQKFSILNKIQFVFIGFCIVFIVQSLKFGFREGLSQNNQSSISLMYDNVGGVVSENRLMDDANAVQSFDRFNQGWIFASTIARMDEFQDFQGLNLLMNYLHAAFLPRFLSADKIKAGDQKVFNTYSGHVVGSNTSMALGIMADGYVSFGNWGVLFFCFFLGFSFSVVYLIISRWTKISKYYILFWVPIMFYAIRPDCETQTIFNHIVKGMLVYWLIVRLTKYNFVVFEGNR